jgi:hypothetical protein
MEHIVQTGVVGRSPDQYSLRISLASQEDVQMEYRERR